MSASDIVHGF